MESKVNTDFNVIVNEWAYRVNDGQPDPKKFAHLYQLSEVLIEQGWPLGEIDKLLQNLRNKKQIIKEAKTNRTEDLHEILTIMKTISGFWLDVIFSITNAVALVIDIAAIIASFIDGPLPIADVLAGWISLLITASAGGKKDPCIFLFNNSGITCSMWSL